MEREVDEFVQEFIAKRRWQFAKTMPKTPHTYTIRSWTPDVDDFERMVAYIRIYGVPERFYSRVGLYLHVGDEKYWTMGEPIAECNVINRAKGSEYYGRQDPEPDRPVLDLGRWEYLRSQG